MEQLEGLTLPDKKKRSIAKKAVFMQYYGTLDRQLSLWGGDLASLDYEEYARE